MAFQPVPNTCSFVVEYGSTARQWTNTFYGYHTSWNETLQLQVADAIMLDLANELMPLIAQDWSIRKVTSYDLRTETGPVVVSTETPTAGSQLDDPLAINCAMVMTMRTGNRGRSGRGRHYIAGFTEVQGGSTAFGSQVLADDVEDAYVHLHNLLDGINVDLRIVQRWANKVELEEGNTISITQFEVRNLKYGSQRRRLGRE